jgi:hypothetical protein
MSSLQPYMDWEANGPSYLTDIEVDEESPSTAEEIWHVAVSWDDVKLMTLDQLDDAFRLDVIAADTPVWKEGMSGWQPLSVVAGMDGQEEEEDEQEEATVMRPFPIQPAPARRAAGPSRAPAPPPRPQATASRAPAPPPRPPAAVSRPPSARPSAPAPRMTIPVAPLAPPSSPFAPTASFAPGPSFPPSRAPSAAPPISLRTASPRSTAPLHAIPSVPMKTQPRMAAVKPTMPLGSPSSLPPAADLGFARSMAPPASYARPMARRRSNAPMWFLAPVAVLGGLFAAYRNDLLLDAARSLHQEERYLAAERALLGVPGFGTPRSVAASSLPGTDAPAEDQASDALKKSDKLDTPSTTPAIDEAPSKPKLDELPAVTPPPKQVAETKPTPEPAPRAVETHKTVAPEKPVAKAAPPPVRAIAAAPAPRPAPAARQAPAPRPTKHDEGGVKAAKVFLSESDEDSAPAAPARHHGSPAVNKAAASFGSVGREEPKPVAAAPKPAPKPVAPPPPPKPEPPPPVVSSGNSTLDDAIRAAATKKHAPAKKKGPGAEYDPLNSDL